MKKILLSLILLSSLLSVSSLVKADDTKKEQGQYSVSVVTSEHQTASIDNFFDIRWTPSTTEQFGIVITNKGTKDQTYDIQVNKARTNRNGIIDYSDQTKEAESSKYKLTEMIKLPKEVTVKAGSSQTVAGSLEFPTVSFDGILMAGIHVVAQQDKDKSATVSNTVAYSLPFVVRGDRDKRPKAVLSLQKISIEKFSSTQSSLDVSLSNEAQTLLKASEFKAEIKDKNGKIITTTSSKIDLTPETQFVYPVKLPEGIKAGNYKLDLTIIHDKDHWTFKKSFTVTGKQAKAIHKRAQVKSPWMLYGVLAASVFGASLLLLLIVVKKKSKIKSRRDSRKK